MEIECHRQIAALSFSLTICASVKTKTRYLREILRTVSPLSRVNTPLLTLSFVMAAIIPAGNDNADNVDVSLLTLRILTILIFSFECNQGFHVSVY